MAKKLNIRLIKKVINHILEVPDRYFQEDIIVTGHPGDFVLESITEQRFAECGTAACIGGWAYILSRDKPRKAWFPSQLDLGRAALGISEDQQEVLFSGVPIRDWPSPFGGHYGAAKSSKAKALVAASLLRKVIATNGRILDRG